MKHVKSALLVGAGITVVSLGTLGVASAATTSSANGEDSLVSKIATKFHLNKSEVQAVFDQNHAEHRAEMKQERADALAQAVKDGKLTQAQADHITSVWNEIDTLAGNTRPDEQSTTTRDAIKAKRDTLHTWAQQQNLDLRAIIGHGGPHGPGGRHHGMDQDDN